MNLSDLDPYYPRLGVLHYGHTPGSIYGLPDPNVCRLLERIAHGTVLDLAAGDGPIHSIP